LVNNLSGLIFDILYIGGGAAVTVLSIYFLSKSVFRFISANIDSSTKRIENQSSNTTPVVINTTPVVRNSTPIRRRMTSSANSLANMFPSRGGKKTRKNKKKTRKLKRGKKRRLTKRR
jgi:hypothetical protein